MAGDVRDSGDVRESGDHTGSPLLTYVLTQTLTYVLTFSTYRCAETGHAECGIN